MPSRQRVAVLVSALVPGLAVLALASRPIEAIGSEGHPEEPRKLWRAQTDPAKGAAAAGKCAKIADCPTFDEVFTNTPPFRHALAEALRRGGQTLPSWVLEHDGASPMLPVMIDDLPYLVGRIHDPKAPHTWLAALYDPEKGWILLRYAKHGDVEPEWFGDPPKLAGTGDQHTKALRKVLAAYLDPNGALGRAATRSDTSLPVQVHAKDGVSD